MLFDLEAMPARDRYKLLASTIVPRPIAWITSVSAAGDVNAAPYSFFNVMGSEPPTVAIGIMPQGDRLKDTAANIRATGQFVINLVGEPNVAAMNMTCIDAPPGVDELRLAGLTRAESLKVAPPRILEAPVAFECRSLTIVEPGPMQSIVIGEVLCANIDDRFVLDRARVYIDTPALNLVARMHGSGEYLRSTDRFRLDRPTWQQWSTENADYNAAEGSVRQSAQASPPASDLDYP